MQDGFNHSEKRSNQFFLKLALFLMIVTIAIYIKINYVPYQILPAIACYAKGKYLKSAEMTGIFEITYECGNTIPDKYRWIYRH